MEEIERTSMSSVLITSMQSFRTSWTGISSVLATTSNPDHCLTGQEREERGAEAFDVDGAVVVPVDGEEGLEPAGVDVVLADVVELADERAHLENDGHVGDFLAHDGGEVAPEGGVQLDVVDGGVLADQRGV